MRIRLLQQALKGKLVTSDEEQLRAWLEDLVPLAEFRNGAAHNPYFWDFTNAQLVRLSVVHGDFAGRADITNLEAFERLWSVLPRYHSELLGWFNGICGKLNVAPAIYFGEQWDRPPRGGPK